LTTLAVEEKLIFLLSYLIHEHGDLATYWFTSTVIKQVDHMMWDNVNDHLITAKEMDLNNFLEDNMDWVANLDASNI
jgi:hypothetical protein